MLEEKVFKIRHKFLKESEIPQKIELRVYA